MVNDAMTAPGPKIASHPNGFALKRAGGGSGTPVCSVCDWGEHAARNTQQKQTAKD